jgi:hypothetical protein
MLLHFPIPYPDELLSSINARYHQEVGNFSPKRTTDELFGKRTIRSVIDLPSNLDLLSKRLNNPLITSDYLINNHTLFPYYGAFFMNDQYENVRNLMKCEKGELIHTTSGISASTIKPKLFLMHCKKCVEDDIETFGETYWHRSHQLPGVFYCYKHETPLIVTKVPVKAENQHEYYLPLEDELLSNDTFIQVPSELVDTLINFSKVSNQLLDGAFRQNHSNSLQYHYINKLKKVGFATNKGYVRREEVYDSFKSKFNKELLHLLQSKVCIEETNWLTMIFRHHRKSFHPVRHILIMMFLGGELHDYFEKEVVYLPFGNGPWLCLNPVCDNYRKKSIVNLKITQCYDTKRPVGTFKCACGFIYSRRGPDLNEENQFKVGRIKQFGHVWESKLRKAMRSVNTLRGVASIMKCDPLTVKRQATILNIPFPWKGKKLNEVKKDIRYQKAEDEQLNFTVLEQRRNEWLLLQKECPELLKTELRKLRPDIYAFLYRNDKEWLNLNSPHAKRTAVINNRVDWDERDKEIYALVRKAVNEWDKNVEKKPKKLTVGSIGKKLRILSLLQKKGDKLPLTMDYLKSVVEDKEAFQIRRVNWVVAKSKQNNEDIIEWKIIRRAGLKSDVSNEVKRVISLNVNELE